MSISCEKLHLQYLIALALLATATLSLAAGQLVYVEGTALMVHPQDSAAAAALKAGGTQIKFIFSLKFVFKMLQLFFIFNRIIGSNNGKNISFKTSFIR